MAFPPATLPTNRTNSTPQTTTHPADHNAISAAINDITTYVTALGVGAARSAVIALQTGQTYTSGQVAQMGWSLKSTATFGAGANFVIPSGGDGMYVCVARVSGPTIGDEMNADLILNMNGTDFTGYIPEGKTQGMTVAANAMAAGNGVTLTVYNPLASSQFYAATLVLMRVSI